MCIGDRYLLTLLLLLGDLPHRQQAAGSKQRRGRANELPRGNPALLLLLLLHMFFVEKTMLLGAWSVRGGPGGVEKAGVFPYNRTR